MIDGGISMDLLARLLSTQLLARGEKHLLDRNRLVFPAAAADHHPRDRRPASCARTARSMRWSKAYALWERHCCMIGVCAAGSIPWWPILMR